MQELRQLIHTPCLASKEALFKSYFSVAYKHNIVALYDIHVYVRTIFLKEIIDITIYNSDGPHFSVNNVACCSKTVIRRVWELHAL